MVYSRILCGHTLFTEVLMNIFRTETLYCALSLLCLLIFPSSSINAQDKDWRPVAPQELTAKTPVVEPDADAEASFWEVRVDDSSVEELALRHYVRVKIFTEKGREQFSRHDVVFTKGTKVKDVEARVTIPDGSTVLLKKEDVLEREIVRANGFKVKAKTFALPGLEIGSIVEYRYKEVLDNATANMRLIFQRDIPIQTVSYYVKPFAGDRGMYYERFNAGETKFEKDKNGYHRATMTNVPAFREEPNMLPDDEVRSWMYIYYLAGVKKVGDEYWKDIGKTIYEGSKTSLKANDQVKQATAEAIAGAASDDEKLQKIYGYVKSQIRNITYADKVTDDDRKSVRNNKSPGDTLKLRMGDAGDVDKLFGAMARAAGFDARVALSGSRNELFFDPRVANFQLMMNSSNIAVKVGEDWRFFSPAGYFSQYGMLSWVEEGQIALISDPKGAIWKDISLADAGKSKEKRTGKFKVLADGTLEGEATIEYTGHMSASNKNSYRGDSDVEREKSLKYLIQSQILSTAEIVSSSIENVLDPEKPLVYRFKIRVPGYASRTGKRIFFQPNVFERSSKPRFISNTRKYDVYFNYPYSEEDDITIELPSGFALENADAPSPIKDPSGIGSHTVKMGVTKDAKFLIYKRDFSFGNKGFIRFPATSYPAVKNLFEAFNKADVHQLTLREGTASASTK